jgi:hypothetical protein
MLSLAHITSSSMLHAAPVARVSAPTMTLETPAAPKFVPAKSLGDYGFDPLGLGGDNRVVPFRHAELKHGRLAMLAAVAWPIQEIFHPALVDALRETNPTATDVLVESGGMSPSLLNGGLEQLEIAPALAIAVFVGSVIDLQDMKNRQAAGLAFNEWSLDSTAGDLMFDPLNIASGLPAEGRLKAQEAELLNGRLAMMAVASYVAIEYGFDTSVVSFTPDLFQPIIFADDFRNFMDASFGAASMDGSIDGVAY